MDGWVDGGATRKVSSLFSSEVGGSSANFASGASPVRLTNLAKKRGVSGAKGGALPDACRATDSRGYVRNHFTGLSENDGPNGWCPLGLPLEPLQTWQILPKQMRLCHISKG